MKLEEVRVRLVEIWDQISDLMEQRNLLGAEYAVGTCPFEVGQKVKFKNNRYLIDEVLWDGEVPLKNHEAWVLRTRKIRKDGEPGNFIVKIRPEMRPVLDQ